MLLVAVPEKEFFSLAIWCFCDDSGLLLFAAVPEQEVFF